MDARYLQGVVNNLRSQVARLSGELAEASGTVAMLQAELATLKEGSREPTEDEDGGTESGV